MGLAAASCPYRRHLDQMASLTVEEVEETSCWEEVVEACIAEEMAVVEMAPSSFVALEVTCILAVAVVDNSSSLLVVAVQL